MRSCVLSFSSILCLALFSAVPSLADGPVAPLYAPSANTGVASMTPGLPLTGRVVSPDGQPLANVPVYVLTKSPVAMAVAADHAPGSAIQANGQTVLTDRTGVYIAQGVRPGDTVSILVGRPGFRYISGGAVSSAFDGYRADDLVVAPPTAVLGGKLVSESGEPVPAATVMAPLSNVDVHASSDPTGQFVLEGLPKGPTDLIAVTRTLYGHARAATGQSGLVVTLKPVVLPDASDFARGSSMLGNIVRTTPPASLADRAAIPCALAQYDVDGALALANLGSPASDDVVLSMISAATLGDVEKAAPSVMPLLDRIVDPGQKALGAAAFGLALTRSNPQLAAPLLDKARLWARQSPIDRYGGDERIAVAALAARLGDRDAGRMVDDTIKSLVDGAKDANKNNPGGADDVVERFMDAYAELIAPAGIDFVDRVLSKLPASRKSLKNVPLTRAVVAMAPYDAPAAAKLLNRSLSMGVTTAMPIYGQAAVAVVEALASTDPKAAYALARTVLDQDHKPIALALAASALPPNESALAFQDALAASLNCRIRTALAGWVASLAYRRDPLLGSQLFTMAWRALSPQVGLPGGFSAFMYYYAQVDPGQARLTIEKEYASALLTLRATDDDTRMLPPALAMASLDIDRATEMAKGIEGVSRVPALIKIAEFTMLPGDKKRTVRFDRWMATDSWLPGMPVDR